MSNITLESAKNDYINAYREELIKCGLVVNDNFCILEDALNEFTTQLKEQGYDIEKTKDNIKFSRKNGT